MADRVLGGRYTVQDKIGIGGMATVYRGLDNVLGRTVAIKTMLPQYAADPSFAARFKQEAQAAAALQSPYIVGVYDWGRDQDTYYIIMEYLRGTDLKSGIRKHGALDCRKVAQIGSQICQALSVAHKHDIIHRDIKPQNIMVQPDGNIKVMDFGIARAKNSHLTADNSVLGTAHYVSPEQTQGKELGPTSDLYSLGIVMYEAATGRVPFDGDDAISVALKQVNEQPVPPSQVNPNVDATLEGIILKCMQKNPADRFQTADELRRVLNDYLAGRIVNLGEATSLISAAPTANMGRNGRTSAIPRAAAATTAQPVGRIATGNGPQHGMPQVPDKKPVSKGKIAGIVIAIIAAAILVGWGVMALTGGNGDTKAMPYLYNKTKDDALNTLASYGDGFFVVTTSEDYDDTVAAGNVKSQDPADGTQCTKGTKVTLVISKGKKPANKVSVPDLTNKTIEEATKLLKDSNLEAENMGPEENSKVESGHVTRQGTAAGSSVDEGTSIQFWYSSGVGKADAGDHVGETESTATAALQKAGFTDVRSEDGDYSDTYAEGVVMSQSPTGNQSKDTTITLTISKGPKPVATTTAPTTTTRPTTNHASTTSNATTSGSSSGGNAGSGTGTGEETGGNED